MTMPIPMSATAMAKAMNAVSYAGPQTSPASASGMSKRLLRAAAWSAPRIAGLSGLDEAGAVEDSRVLLLDRHALAIRLARILDEAAPLESVDHARKRLRVLRLVATRATGLWDPWTRTRILVPPNALAAAHRYSLDQSDWSKWVALRTGLLGALVLRAPFLVAPDARVESLLERLVLAEALADAMMASITPARLPSVEWLRHHGPSPSLAGSIATRIGVSSPLLDERHRIPSFALEVVRSGRLDLLLAAPEKLPDAAELVRPDAWAARVS